MLSRLRLSKAALHGVWKRCINVAKVCELVIICLFLAGSLKVGTGPEASQNIGSGYLGHRFLNPSDKRENRALIDADSHKDLVQALKMQGPELQVELSGIGTRYSSSTSLYPHSGCLLVFETCSEHTEQVLQRLKEAIKIACSWVLRQLTIHYRRV